MPPLRTERLLHPETVGEEREGRPFRVGLRNSVVALAAIGVGGLGYLVRFHRLRDLRAWWMWPAVAAGAAAVCFGHAYLGARIGGRRANSVAVDRFVRGVGGADPLDEVLTERAFAATALVGCGVVHMDAGAPRLRTSPHPRPLPCVHGSGRG